MGTFDEVLDAFANAVRDIISPRSSWDGGRIVAEPSRYRALADQVQRVSAGQGGRGGAPGSRAPLWVDGLDLRTDLQRLADELWSEGNGVEYKLYSAAGHDWDAGRQGWLAAQTRGLRRMARAIDAVMDPGVSMELSTPCPECESTVLGRLSGGEVYRFKALVVTPDHLRCRACHSTWTSEQFHDLAAFWGLASPQEVA